MQKTAGINAQPPSTTKNISESGPPTSLMELTRAKLIDDPDDHAIRTASVRMSRLQRKLFNLRGELTRDSHHNCCLALKPCRQRCIAGEDYHIRFERYPADAEIDVTAANSEPLTRKPGDQRAVHDSQRQHV